ncbi:MAG: NADPH:quinone reductase [Gammaproteobacteria bacterium]|jgi:NADPH:quinone reductase-like Zn-dependent oxidoreductase|nr:NADPH:quinone reductase [Gammaproteobacteria bacterium]
MTAFKAAYYETVGKAEDVLKLEMFELAPPKENEVQIEIVTSAINPSDVKIRQGNRGPLTVPSLIPHSDGAGIVTACGSAVTQFKPGDRVWMYNAARERNHGTASTLINLPVELVVPLADNTTFETGACLGIPALTAAACLLSLNSECNDTILITGGAGAVGMCAIQLAKVLGFKTIATVRSEEKAHIAKQMGADYVINTSIEKPLDKIKQYTHDHLLNGLVDVDFGGNLDWSIDALKDNSAIATYASMGKTEPALPFYAMMFKQLSLHFIFAYILSKPMRTRAIELVQNALRENKLTPRIAKIYPLEDIVQAHLAVEAGNKIGQVLIRND